MSKKNIAIISCLTIYILILSGCWNRFEPKGLAFATSILYDITEDNQFEVIIEFLNPTEASNGSKGNGSSNKTIVTSFSANSIGEAIRKNSTTIDKVLYLAHNRARFFSEKLARDDITPLIDLFARDRQSRQSVYMSVIKGDDPKLIYSAETGLSDNVGDYIEGLIKSEESILTESVYTTLLDFMKDYYEDGKQPVLGTIEIIEDTEPAKKQSEAGDSKASSSQEKPKEETKYKIKYNGLAAFKDGKLVGFMDSYETRAYNIVVGKFRGSIISVPYKIKDTVFNVGRTKTESKTSMDQNGRIKIDINIKIGISLSNTGGDSDVSKLEVMNELKQNFNKLIEEQVSGAIKKAQTEFKSDIFGFGLRMHEQNPKEWEKCKDNWDQCFETAEINVKVESVQIGAGVTKQPFKLEF